MSIVNIFSRGLKELFTDRSALLTIIGGVLFYAVLYPQPYLSNLPEQQAVALVDLDQTSASRKLARWIDATPEVQFTRQLSSVSEARDQLIDGAVHGMIVIPRHYMRDSLLGRSPVVSMAGDANYFLVYGTVVEGATMALQAAFSRQTAGAPSVALNLMPLFNPTMGYLGYVIPAVFVLILQQTALLASGLIGAGFNEKLTVIKDPHHETSVYSLLAGRFLAMFAAYFVLGLLYLGWCFQFYGIERSADPKELLAMLVAFTAATTSLGLLLGAWLPRKEWAAPLVMISSLPLVFSAGFVWPLESTPGFVKVLSSMAPSTTAIQGFLGLNQMGASFSQVAMHWGWLWFLAVTYASAAWWVQRQKLKKPVTGDYREYFGELSSHTQRRVSN